MLLNKQNKKLLEEYPKLIENIKKADGGRDNTMFSILRKREKEIIKHFCNEFGLEYNRHEHYDFVDMIIDLLRLSSLENPSEIILFKDFANQFQWDKEKIELFHHLNPRCGQRNLHIQKWYTGIEYKQLDKYGNYEFILRK